MTSFRGLADCFIDVVERMVKKLLLGIEQMIDMNKVRMTFQITTLAFPLFITPKITWTPVTFNCSRRPFIITAMGCQTIAGGVGELLLGIAITFVTWSKSYAVVCLLCAVSVLEATTFWR